MSIEHLTINKGDYKHGNTSEDYLRREKRKNEIFRINMISSVLKCFDLQ